MVALADQMQRGVAESSRSANGRMDKKSSAKTVIPIGPALTTASALRSLW